MMVLFSDLYKPPCSQSFVRDTGTCRYAAWEGMAGKIAEMYTGLSNTSCPQTDKELADSGSS